MQANEFYVKKCLIVYNEVVNSYRSWSQSYNFYFYEYEFVHSWIIMKPTHCFNPIILQFPLDEIIQALHNMNATMHGVSCENTEVCLPRQMLI